MGDEADHVAVQLIDEREPRLAEADRVPHDRVEDRPGVGRGGAHDAQHVGGRGLLLEGVGEIVVAGVELGEEPDVLDRDHRLVREGPEELDLPVREPARLGAPDRDRADRPPFPHHRDRGQAAEVHRPAHLGELVLGVGANVGDLDHAAGQDRAPGGGAPIRGPRERAERRGASLGRVSVGRHVVHRVPVGSEDLAELGIAEPPPALRDGVEDRLSVGRGARNDAQDLSGDGLLLEGFGQIAVPRFQLGEEAHVLDRDDRLVREGLEQGDLALGERPFDLGHDDGADGLVLAQHGHDQESLVTLRDRQLARAGGHGGIVLYLMNVNGARLAHRVGGDVVARHRHREQPVGGRQSLRRPVVVRDQMQDAPF